MIEYNIKAFVVRILKNHRPLKRNSDGLVRIFVPKSCMSQRFFIYIFVKLATDGNIYYVLNGKFNVRLSLAISGINITVS